jgi:hypothetical protein
MIHIWSVCPLAAVAVGAEVLAAAAVAAAAPVGLPFVVAAPATLLVAALADVLAMDVLATVPPPPQAVSKGTPRDATRRPAPRRKISRRLGDRAARFIVCSHAVSIDAPSVAAVA